MERGALETRHWKNERNQQHFITGSSLRLAPVMKMSGSKTRASCLSLYEPRVCQSGMRNSTGSLICSDSKSGRCRVARLMTVGQGERRLGTRLNKTEFLHYLWIINWIWSGGHFIFMHFDDEMFEKKYHKSNCSRILIGSYDQLENRNIAIRWRILAYFLILCMPFRQKFFFNVWELQHDIG